VDVDESRFLEKDELTNVMRSVAFEMKVKPPTDGDIDAVLKELDENNDGQVSKEEFLVLIVQVLRKMLESEEDLQASIDAQTSAASYGPAKK